MGVYINPKNESKIVGTAYILKLIAGLLAFLIIYI